MDKMQEEKKYTLTWDRGGVTQSFVINDLNEVAYMGLHRTRNYILMYYEHLYSIYTDFSWDKKPAGWDDLYEDFNERNL